MRLRLSLDALTSDDDDDVLLANQNVSQICQFSLFSAVSRTTVVYKPLQLLSADRTVSKLVSK